MSGRQNMTKKSIAKAIGLTALCVASGIIAEETANGSQLLKQAFPNKNNARSAYAKRCECMCQNEYSQYPGRKMIHHC